ncbi:MAG: NAD(P)/FAD-dependent oxidoreductase [Pseudomonadota bacterium]
MTRAIERVDTIVIGAGVVGLAVARALQLSGRDVFLLEKNASFGEETSSRNSEVIHAGIYYRPGGLRAQLCHPGKQMLYAYCKDRGVTFDNCGKLVVGHTADDHQRLVQLKETANQNGVTDVKLISKNEIIDLEPKLNATTALFSPSSGIIDSHGFMLAILGDFENAGGTYVSSTEIVSGSVESNGITISIGGNNAVAFKAKLVVNSAGLCADKVAESINGLSHKFIPRVRPAKGLYFAYTGAPPFSRLIYPVHSADSQGIHYTKDLGGQAKLGPDISWDAPLGDYSLDETKRDIFFKGARKFWPDLEKERLQASYAGQRPKLTGPGEEGDFRPLFPEDHGTNGYIGLYGIESPGLTASLAIAEYVLQRLKKPRN